MPLDQDADDALTLPEEESMPPVDAASASTEATVQWIPTVLTVSEVYIQYKASKKGMKEHTIPTYVL